MKFTKTVYDGIKEILATKNFEGISVMVDSTDIDAGEDGKKVVKAGTIVGGKTLPVLSNDNEVVVTKNTALLGKDAEGVLLYDVDVSNGDAPGSMVIRGNIDISKIETPVDEAIAALKSRVLFIK